MKLKEAIAWCAGVLVTGAVAIAFLFMTFQTSANSKDDAEQINRRVDETIISVDHRLDRIERKLDRVIENHR